MTGKPGDSAAYTEALTVDKLLIGQRVTFKTTTGHACGAVIGHAWADDVSSGDGRPMVLIDLDRIYRGYIHDAGEVAPYTPEIYVSYLVAAPGNLARIGTCEHCGREIEEDGPEGDWIDLGSTPAAMMVRCFDPADPIPTDTPSDQRHEPAPVTR